VPLRKIVHPALAEVDARSSGADSGAGRVDTPATALSVPLTATAPP